MAEPLLPELDLLVLLFDAEPELELLFFDPPELVLDLAMTLSLRAG
ncbi:MAG: hypothetical protein ACM3ZV_08475 [Bacillota bacterium]